MKINDAFPSTYINAADLKGKRAVVTIEKVGSAKMPDGEIKPVLYFRGKEKGLVLNKTNANAVWGIAGTDETDEWKGVAVTLFSSKTTFQGKTVDCIRVDPPDSPQKAQPQRRPEPEPEQYENDDDSVPF